MSVRAGVTAPMRGLKLGSNAAEVRRRPDGADIVTPLEELGPYPERLADRFVHFAETAPDRVYIGARDASGGWRTFTYAEAFQAARAIGTALLRRGLDVERPVMILSGNDIEHALLAVACLYVGVPYASISPAYSTVAKDFGKLRHIAGKLTPGMIFAADGAVYAAAIDTIVSDESWMVTTRNAPPGREATLFSELISGPIDDERVDAAAAAVRTDDVAKFLFTSGSTGLPKGVVNPHRMLTANQEMLTNYFRFMREEPPVIIDWLPWNHTFGGNHNFGLVIYNGGSLYIDDGRPTPGGIKATVRNLREIAPTVYFNVPKGFEELVPFLREDRELRKTFFSRLNMIFFAGAGLAQHVWDELDVIAVQELGERIPIVSGLGATETGPFALVCAPEHCLSGAVGMPVPGVEVKLTPSDGKLEARVRGPAITPGYWREPELTAKAFDEEGWYKLGDALRLLDPEAPEKGYAFDGRIGEDFKLATGTWVSVGPMRAKFIDHFAPLVRDVVIGGLNHDDVVALAFPDVEACRAFVGAARGVNDVSGLLADPKLKAELAARLTSLAALSTGSSTRFARMMMLEAPPSLDVGEITDKGSINQRAVLSHRADLVEELYARPFPPRVIVADDRSES